MDLGVFKKIATGLFRVEQDQNGALVQIARTIWQSQHKFAILQSEQQLKKPFDNP